MNGARFEKNRRRSRRNTWRGFRAENDADAGRSFAGVEGMTRTDSYGLV